MPKTHRRASKVKVSYQKVQRSTKRRQKAQITEIHRPIRGIRERELGYVWMDFIPEGWNPLDWFRAWNDGFPAEEHVEIFNSLHDEADHIVLVDED